MSEQGFTINKEEELDALCPKLIEFAGDKKIWIFSGEMGSGKTTFIRHICNFLAVKDAVGSPTYSLMNEYQTDSGNRICHFDFYRIQNLQEAVDIGCEEYFYSGSLCFIEWAEKILNLVPRPLVRITIEQIDETRTITFTHER